jgi:NAD-dependent SIR2 family protein deacetylase
MVWPTIPRPLIEDFELDRLVLFAGAGVSVASGILSGTGLADALENELIKDGVRHKPTHRLNEAAAMYEAVHGRDQLISAVARLLRAHHARPNEAHRLAVALFRQIVTTNFDDLFEQAVRTQDPGVGRNLDPVTIRRDADFARLRHIDSTRDTVVIKLHGDLEASDRIVITEKDYNQLEDDRAIQTYVRACFLERRPLFVGYSLGDPDLLRTLVFCERALGPLTHRAYAVIPGVEEGDPLAARLAQYNVDVISKDAVSFLKELRQSKGAPFTRGDAVRPPAPTDVRPPKFTTLVIVIEQDSPFDQAEFLAKLGRLLGTTSMRVLERTGGSIRLVIEMPKDKAERLVRMHLEGDLQLQKLGVQRVEIVKSVRPTVHDPSAGQAEVRGASGPSKGLRVLRIVVASPGDVAAERRVMPIVIGDLKPIAAEHGLQLDLRTWETDAYPGFHPGGPQGQIDAALDVEDCDVLIGIFWKRFGTPVKDSKSGTAHEFQLAYKAWKQDGRPHIMVYFNEKAYAPRSTEELQQWQEVLNFKNNFPREGLWWPYKGKNEFERLVRSDLTRFILDRYPRFTGGAGQTEERGKGSEGVQETRHRHRTSLKPHTKILVALLGLVAVASLVIYLRFPRSYQWKMETIPQDIMIRSDLAKGFDMGVNSALGMTDWVAHEDAQMRISFPGSQAWGAVFITVGPPTPPPRPFRDFSAYRTLSVDMKGQEGGEKVDIGIKADTQPDDGSETKVPVELTSSWRTYDFLLSKFAGADLTHLYVVAEFVFTGPRPEAIYFRNIKYLPASVGTSTNPSPEAVVAANPTNAARPTVGSPSAGTAFRQKASAPPSWEQVLHDLRSAHGHERVVEINEVDGPEFSETTNGAADKNSSAWTRGARDAVKAEGRYCRQLAWVTVENSAGNRSCHIEAAVYARVASGWEFQGKKQGQEGCGD